MEDPIDKTTLFGEIPGKDKNSTFLFSTKDIELYE